MNFFSNIFFGRNGIDKLSITLIVVAAVLALAVRFTQLEWLLLVAFLPMIWALFRMFSTNTVKRRAENYSFITFFGRVKSWFVLRRDIIRDRHTHKYLRCPKCKRTLRLPKGKGKILITCPSCQNAFQKKT